MYKYVFPLALSFIVFGVVQAPYSKAQNADSDAIMKEINALKRSYEARLNALENRISVLNQQSKHYLSQV